MNSEHLHAKPAIEVDPDGLFGACGMIPGGDLWIVPTDTFLLIWQTPVGDHLRQRGFRLVQNGKQIGADYDCVICFPAELMEELSEMGSLSDKN